ncbi:tetratricopeptide repeat protein [uncultured Gordonia sp.]|uniref:DUF4062 domain-containing protein n=1 Tax=Gordonia sp. (in: high G+C Gram-positive bacteria) TaxID=84139 RepID=UPI003452AB1C
MAVVPVFVSSTFRDFHGERDVLVGGVRERLDESLRDLGCRVEVIDLRWGVDTVGVDEEEAARRVVDVCLQQVARARPLFVGLVGERVGYVPDGVHARWVADQAGVPVDQRVEGLSVTELEFGFGMLWDSAPDGEHVVVFRELVGAAPAGWVDPDHDRVARFRDDVAAKAADRGVATLRYEVTVVAVGDTVDLAIVASGGEETSFEDLMVGVLSGPVRRRAELVIAESGGGWVGAERLFRDDHTVAVGREPLIGDLTARMAVGGRVVLVGESGTGKSTVLCAVEDRLRADPELTVVSVLVGASSTGVSGRDVVVRLVEQLQPLIGRELSAPTDGDEDGFIQWWRDVLTEAQTAIEGRLVIVVDALDVLADDRARSDVWPVRVIPPSIGLLCSTTSPDQAAALTGVGVDRLDVGDLSPAIAVEAARSWAGQAGRALPASVLAIVGEAARSPLWVRLAVDLLADLDAEDFASIAAAADQAAAIERLLFEEARSLPSDTADLAGVFLGRVAERIGDEPAALLLGVLATARSGLAPADLAALLPDDPDAGLTVAIAQRVLGDQLRTIDAAGRLTFAHAIVQWHAASLAGPGVHARIVEVLANDDVWDDTDALDVIWHTIAASAESDGEQPVHAGVLARAANHRPPGGELVLMRAIDAHPGAGIALIRQLDRSALTDGGMELFLDAPDKVDRRYVGPRDRVGLSMSVVGLARSGMAEARDRQVSTALNNLGDDCLAVGDLDGADVAFEESLELRRGLVQTQPGSVDAQRELSVALNRVAGFRGVRGDLAGAEEVFEESLELRRGLVQARPESVAARRDLSIALDWVGDVRQVRGDRDGALLAFEESLELARGLVQARPGSVDAQRELSVALNRVGDVRRMGGDFDGADEVFGESRALRRGLVQAQPGSVEAQRDLSVVLNRIGDVRQVRGELDGAVEVFEESLELARELARVQPGSVQTQRDLSVALNRVGEIRQLRGDFAGAVEVFEESLELARGLVRGQQESPQAVRDLLVSLRNVANILDDLNDPEGAARARAEAAELEVPPS